MKTIRIKSIDGDESFNDQQVTLLSGKNLILCLERESYDTFLDTVNSNWVIKYLSSMADIENISQTYSNNKNIALVHHGNVYSATKAPEDKKVVLDNKWLSEYIPKVYNSITDEEKKLDADKLSDLLHEKSKTFYTGGLEKKVFIAYINLKLLMESLVENGNYFSIACDEADDEAILETIANLTSKNCKVYGNSNFSNISSKSEFPKEDKKANPPIVPIVKDYGSIFNSFLTGKQYDKVQKKYISNWKDNSGWKYFDKKVGKIIVTNKDLVIYSVNPKVYELKTRGVFLTKEQELREANIQIFYSKKFKTAYTKKYGSEAFDKFKKTILTNYPELK